MPDDTYISQKQKTVCTPYNNGYIRLDNPKGADETYILPMDLDAVLTNTGYPFLYVLAHFGDTSEPILGLSAFNPGEFMNGHAILVGAMKQQLSTPFYIALSGVLYLTPDTCLFSDNSGHFYENIYHEIISRYGKHGYVDYIETHIVPMMSRAYDGKIAVKFQPYDPEAPPNIFTLYDSPDVWQRFRARICPKKVDYLVYGDYGECMSGMGSVGTFCSDEARTRQSIDRRMLQLYHERVPRSIAPLVNRLYSGLPLTDTEIMTLQKLAGLRRLPITANTRDTILARLKQYFPASP